MEPFLLQPRTQTIIVYEDVIGVLLDDLCLLPLMIGVLGVDPHAHIEFAELVEHLTVLLDLDDGTERLH